MSKLAIEIAGVRKSYGGKPALDGLDLEVPRGSIFGLLGRNGAGKTTTIKMLMGFLRADQGQALVSGLSVTDATNAATIRQKIGFVSEDKELYPYMTVGQLVRFTRSFFPGWRTDLEDRYLRMFDLPPDRKVPKLSKGMRSKLLLLLAIARRPEILILDEPMDGLDPVAAEDTLRELVDMSAGEETTVFFSSHQIADVEQIADCVSIIDEGKALVAGSLDDLKDRYRRFNVVLDSAPSGALDWPEGVEHVRQQGRTVSLLASRNIEAIETRARTLPGAFVESFPLTLKEIFLGHMRSS